MTCPALPGLVTEGDTLEEARTMAADAIRGYLESLRKDGQPIPTDKAIPAEPRKEHISVALVCIPMKPISIPRFARSAFRLSAWTKIRRRIIISFQRLRAGSSAQESDRFWPGIGDRSASEW